MRRAHEGLYTTIVFSFISSLSCYFPLPFLLFCYFLLACCCSFSVFSLSSRQHCATGVNPTHFYNLTQGLQKPSPECFAVASQHLAVPVERLLLVDDRKANVQAALQAGLDAVHFVDAQQLRGELAARGLLEADPTVQ